MSEELPRVTADKVIKVLEHIGSVLERQSGSHNIKKHSQRCWFNCRTV